MRRLLLALLLVVALTSSAFAQIPPGGSGGGTTLTDSASLATALSDETGTGLAVFNTSPTLVTPVLGVAAATSLNKITITAPATGATLTVIDGKTFTVNKTLTLDGTDGTTMTFPSTSATLARTDAANSFTGTQTFLGNLNFVAATSNDVFLKKGASQEFWARLGDDSNYAFSRQQGTGFYNGTNLQVDINYGASGVTVLSGSKFKWVSSATNIGTVDVALARAAAGLLEVDTGVAGTFADLKLAKLFAAEVSADPSAADLTSGANAKDRVAVYMKNDKLVFAYNASGTVTYLTVPLDGSTILWTQSTSAP